MVKKKPKKILPVCMTTHTYPQRIIIIKQLIDNPPEESIILPSRRSLKTKPRKWCAGTGISSPRSGQKIWHNFLSHGPCYQKDQKQERLSESARTNEKMHTHSLCKANKSNHCKAQTHQTSTPSWSVRAKKLNFIYF